MGTDPMADEIDWHLTTWEGNRRRQHEAFRALPFREKLAVLEALGEMASLLVAKHRERVNAHRPAKKDPEP